MTSALHIPMTSRIITSLLMYALTSSLIPLTSPQAPAACPAQCACRVDRAGRVTYVDCRARGLTRVISDVPHDVTELDLSENQVTAANRSSFPSTLRVLRRLSMNDCLLERLESMTFRNLILLELLELSRNRIRSLDDSAFYGLASLRELRLGDNQLTALPNYIFRSLSLATLDLGGNDLEGVGGEVFQAAGVEFLNLGGNRLERLDAGALSPLGGSLTQLTLSGNRRPLVISEDAFSRLTLTTLDIASSMISDPSFLSQLSARMVSMGGNPLGGARFPSRSPRLADSCLEMTLSGCNLTELDAGLAAGLRRIERLDLSRNSILSLDPGVLRGMPALKVLDLSGNRALTRLPAQLAQQLAQLETLNLSHCGLTGGISGTPFLGAPRLSTLGLSHNALQSATQQALLMVLNDVTLLRLSPNPWHCNCELAWLQRWIQTNGGASGGDSRGAGGVKCTTAALPGAVGKFLGDLSPSDLVCTPPRIERITASLNLDEGLDALLSCVSHADPAADIVWRAPFGETFSITPPSNRTVRATYATWQINRIRGDQAGWYSCTASSAVAGGAGGAQAGATGGSGELQGAQAVGYTYVHVVTPTSPPVDLEGLQYPDLPEQGARSSPSTMAKGEISTQKGTSKPPIVMTVSEKGESSTPAVTSVVRSVSTVSVAPGSVTSGVSVVSPNEGESGGLPGGDRSPFPSYSDVVYVISTTSNGQDMVDPPNYILIICIVLGVVGAAVVLLIVGVLCLRRRKRRREGKYPVKERHDEELPYNQGGRRLPTELLPLHDPLSKEPKHAYV